MARVLKHDRNLKYPSSAFLSSSSSSSSSYTSSLIHLSLFPYPPFLPFYLNLTVVISTFLAHSLQIHSSFYFIYTNLLPSQSTVTKCTGLSLLTLLSSPTFVSFLYYPLTFLTSSYSHSISYLSLSFINRSTFPFTPAPPPSPSPSSAETKTADSRPWRPWETMAQRRGFE